MAFAGFDCGDYPGDDSMRAWAMDATYKWCGYYLLAPCHGPKFKPWTGKYQFLRGLGLGLAVLYVGRQQAGCGSGSLSRPQGQTDGLDTIAKCNQEGFPQDVVVFLDVEHFDGDISANMKDYYKGWIGAILDDGKFKPGTYCADSNANDLINAAQEEYAAHGLPGGNPAFWVVKNDLTFDPQSSVPGGSGVSFANVWQGRIGVVGEAHGGFTISPIDQDVADSIDPSATLQFHSLAFRQEINLTSAAKNGMDQLQNLLSQVISASSSEPPAGDPHKRLLFPNGIDLIDATVKLDLKDGFTIQLKLQGPVKV
jgi:hypothetical protein